MRGIRIRIGGIGSGVSDIPSGSWLFTVYLRMLSIYDVAS